ncbi:MAG: hypothetical protein NC236_02965 [Mycoplasma sp.]|nr:hypothetical protein [Mycoplasma sp.]
MNDYLMHIIIDVIYIVGMTLTYFTFKNREDKITSLITEIFVYALVTLLASVLYWYTNSDFAIVITISTVVILFYYKKSIFSLIAITPASIFILIIFYNNSGIFVAGLSTIGVAIIAFVFEYILNMKKKLYLLFLVPIYLLVNWSYLLYSIIESKNIDAIKFFTNSSLPVLILFVSIFLIKYVDKTIKSTISLQRANNFSYDNFFKRALSEEKINDFISKNNITHGIFLNIKVVDYGNSDVKKINTILTNLVYQKFGVDNIFTEISINSFSVFQKIDNVPNLLISIQNNEKRLRNNQDIFVGFQERMSEALKYLGKEIRIKCSAIVYGLQTSSISSAIEYTNFLIDSNNDSENLINVFNPRDFIIDNENRRKIEKINGFVDINSVFNNYRNIYSLEKDKSIYHIAIPNVSQDEIIKIDELLEFSKKNQVFSTLQRYLASISLKDFYSYSSVNQDNTKLLLNYSCEYLGSRFFNLPNFLNKLNKNNISFNDLILIFNATDLKKITNRFIKNLNILREHGIKAAISGVNPETKIEVINYIKPKVILLDEKIYLKNHFSEEMKNFVLYLYKNFKNVDIIVENVSSMLMLKNIILSGVKNFSGKLFEKDSVVLRKLPSLYKQYSSEISKDRRIYGYN